MLTFILLLTAGAVFLSLIYWALKLGIGPTPTSARVRITIASVLPDKVQGSIVELGCGWGQLLPLLKEKYPSQSIIGYERSPVPCHYSRITNQSITIKREDFFRADLSKAGLIVCYLYPDAMNRINKEIIRQLPEHCWILTHTFALPDATAIISTQSADLYKTPVYLYRTGSHNQDCT